MQSLASEVKQILNEFAQNGGEELRKLDSVPAPTPHRIFVAVDKGVV